MPHRFEPAIGLFLACLFAAAASISSAQDLATERVFGPEVPTGPYKHPACAEVLTSGDLLLVYYGGEGEYARDTAVFLARKPKGSASWTPPVVVAKDPLCSLGNAVIWQAPDQTVWLFYVVRPGATWSSSRIAAKLSRDLGKTWSDPTILAWDAGMMVRNRPIVLASGEYLLPVYHERGDDTESVAPDSTSTFLKYNPQSRAWRQAGSIRSPKGNIQPAPVEIEPNHLVAYCRRGGDYNPSTIGWIVRSESRDGGESWTEGADTAFPNPNAAVDFLKLQSGSLLLVYNNSQVDRSPLTVALSDDRDRSYTHQRDIATGPDSFAYPIAFQDPEGLIHVIYTSDRRSVIRHATFGEAWIRAGGPLDQPIIPLAR
jgi:predicted neuraminidase